jgi:subtilisin family serine protease
MRGLALRIIAISIAVASCMIVALDPLANPAAGTVRNVSSAPASDPQRPQQWAMDTLGFESVWGSYTRGAGVTVAIIDGGVDGSHPDLQGQLVPGAECLAWNGRCTPAKTAVDVYGHGSWSAGYIAAKADNGIGIAGGAPDAKIMPIRVVTDIDQYNPRFDLVGSYLRLGPALANGIRWAVDNGASIISVSFGLCFTDRYLDPKHYCVPSAFMYAMGYNDVMNAVAYARSRGVLMVASAGNNSLDRSAGIRIVPSDLPGVIAAGAIDENLNRMSYSNAGPYVDFAAPGNALRTTAPLIGRYSDPSGYASGGGTSAAAPYVAAVAALVRSANPTLKPDQVEAILRATATDRGAPGRDDLFGAGIPDSWRAVRMAQGLDPNIKPTGVNLRLTGTRGSQDLAVQVADRRFALDLDNDPTLASRRSMNDLTPGTHTLTVTDPSGVGLRSLTCAGGRTVGTVNRGNATVVVPVTANSVVDCEAVRR